MECSAFGFGFADNVLARGFRMTLARPLILTSARSACSLQLPRMTRTSFVRQIECPAYSGLTGCGFERGHFLVNALIPIVEFHFRRITSVGSFPPRLLIGT